MKRKSHKGYSAIHALWFLRVPDTKPVLEHKGFFGVFEYSSPLFFGNPVLALRDHTLRNHNACIEKIKDRCDRSSKATLL